MRMSRLLAAALIVSGPTLLAADYLTEGVDPARTGWMRNEKIFTPANVKDMKLLWKIKLDSTPREMHNLFSPLIVENVTTAQGPREIAVVAGVSDQLFGVDAATGELLWSKKFESTYPPPGVSGRGGGTLCPGGQTAVPAIGPAISPGKYPIYAVSWDGRLRKVNVADGQDLAPPEKFLQPNGKAVRAESGRQRDLHRQRAGLRRRAQFVLLLRSGVAPDERVPARGRRPVGPARRGGRARRHGLSRHRRRSVQPRAPAASATPSSA